MISDLLAFCQHIIYIDFHGLINLMLKHLVHQSLVRGPNIFQPKAHDLIAIEASVADESGAFLIRLVHQDLVVFKNESMKLRSAWSAIALTIKFRSRTR